jgi:hypothetical protein
MTQFDQENYLGQGGGGEVDDDLLDEAWEQSLAPAPNNAPESERPSTPPVPGPTSVNEPQ